MATRPRPIHPPVVLQLAALPNAVSSARRHTCDLLPRWGYEALVESCELLVSELVTNAVKASGGLAMDTDSSEYRERLTVVKLRLLATSTSIFIEVWDGNPTPPVAKEAELDAEGGRGLLLVQMLSARWNVYFPASGGKIVWCEVRRE